jgi:hypothetical protein
MVPDCWVLVANGAIPSAASLPCLGSWAKLEGPVSVVELEGPAVSCAQLKGLANSIAQLEGLAEISCSPNVINPDAHWCNMYS